MRLLRARSAARVRAARRAAGLPPPAREVRAVDAEATPAIAVIDENELRVQIFDIVRTVGRGNIKATMICHVLRGSSGEATRRIVARHALPHDGALRGFPYPLLRETVAGIAAQAPFRLVDGYVRLVVPPART